MLSGVKMRILLGLSIFLLSQAHASGKELCLCCGVDIMQQNMGNCTLPVVSISDDDLVMLKKLCVQHKSESDTQAWYYKPYGYLTVEGWKISYNPDFLFDDCVKDLDNLAEKFFWVTNLNSTGSFKEIYDMYIARKVMYSGTDEIISQLGRYVIGTAYNSELFDPIYLEGVPDISAFPGYYQYLIRRLPLNYEVTDPQVLRRSSREIQEEHLGAFTYHNPSNYPQKLSIELGFPSDVTYETEEYLVPDRPLEYRGPNETLKLRTGEFFTETLNYTINFNVTVKPRRTVTGRVVGVWSRYDTVFTATLNTTFQKLGSFADYEVKKNVTGTKINIRFGRFYLEDLQEYRSDEVIILSYSAVSGILFGIAFLMILVLLFHIVKKCKKCCKKTPTAEGYTVLNS